VNESRRHRWPGAVYDVGQEPDYRFTLANERTFLARIRTALGMVAASVALATIDVPVPAWAQRLGAVVLAALGLACAGTAWFRWARVERAMRTGEPLPSPWIAATVATTVCVVAVALALLLL
jgi:putative membrane protein